MELGEAASVQFSLVHSLSRVWLFVTWTAVCQASLSITNSWSLLKLMTIKSVMSSNYLILCHPLLFLPLNLSQQQGLFQWLSSSHQVAKVLRVSALASVLPMNIQDWFPLGWTGWISWQSRDSQESSSTPQFKSINSSELSFLYSPTLTAIHDNWENNSFD